MIVLNNGAKCFFCALYANSTIRLFPLIFIDSVFFYRAGKISTCLRTCLYIPVTYGRQMVRLCSAVWPRSKSLCYGLSIRSSCLIRYNIFRGFACFPRLNHHGYLGKILARTSFLHFFEHLEIHAQILLRFIRNHSQDLARS